MISSEKKSAGPTSRADSTTRSRWLRSGSRSRCLCRFSTITTEASTITPMAMAMPPRLMMLALMPSHRMPMNAISTPTGRVKIATKARAEVEQEEHADRGDHQHLLGELLAQRRDRPLDQLRAVVGDVDLDALRQALLELVEALLHPLDHAPGVLAEAQQHDARDDLALAVHVDETASHLGPELDAGHLAQQDRRVPLRIDARPGWSRDRPVTRCSPRSAP